MKSALALAFGIFTLTTASALAADVVVSQPVPQPGDPVTNAWSGAYLGAGVGYNWSVFDFENGAFATATSPGVASTGYDDDDDGVSGHVLGGYLLQYRRLIFGAEGDFTFGETLELAPPSGFLGCAPCADAGGIASLETRGHIRAILGAEVNPRIMLFAAGGAAIAKITYGGVWAAATSTGGAAIAAPGNLFAVGTAAAALAGGPPSSDTRFGYSLGGGVQVKATENLIVRAEALYDDYGSMAISSFAAAAAAAGGADSAAAAASSGNSLKVHNTTARLSLIWKF